MAALPTIAKLPLRVYTPIPNLQYNDTVAQDIAEIPDFLNVNMESGKSLSPITYQVHEPNESLRTVPWVKPTGYIDKGGGSEEELSRGVYIFDNGVWKSCVPAFESAAAMAAEVTSIKEAIYKADVPPTGYTPRTEALEAEVVTKLEEIEVVSDSVTADRLSTHQHFVRARQFSCASSFLWGKGSAVIPAGSGVFDTVGQPDGHAEISFTDDLNESTNPSSTGLSPTESSFRAYNHPFATVGAGWDWETLTWWRRALTYRTTRTLWNDFRLKTQWYRAQKGWPVLEFPEYEARDWAHDFGYYFSSNGAAYTDPVIFINFSGEDDTDITQFTQAYVQLTYTLVAEAPDPLLHYVTGFRVWFASYDVTGTSAAPSGTITPAPRSFKFDWCSYGKRRVPPEFDSWQDNLT